MTNETDETGIQRLISSFYGSVKQLAVFPRYWMQVWRSRRAFKRFSDEYPGKTIFIAGLPKSGTTWLKEMLLSYRGFHEVLIPEVTFYEMKTGGSHDYELPDDIFSRFDDMLVVTKMHVYGSEHNARLLRDAGVKYVVLYRDLRDVAVSHYFYVRKTPWHPEYPIYRPLSPEEGLLMFADRSLDDFAEWVRLWDRNRDRDLSISVRYEDMLADTTAVMRSVAEHFELDASSDTIKRIVEAHSFQRMARGREPGEQDSNSFVRKGVAGDWKNWFTHEIKQEFKDKIGEFLIEYGYETDHVW